MKKIICGFAGIGKSYLAKNKEGYVDLESTPFEGGWRLKLAYGSSDYVVSGAVFKRMEEIEQLTHDGKVVFVHLKNSKYKVK